jgi:hypothetical protein
MAKFLGLPKEAIESVRDPLIQEEIIGIPSDRLIRHAYHKISIHDGSVNLVMETRVFGQAPYASGLARIIEAIYKRELKPGTYDVLALVR